MQTARRLVKGPDTAETSEKILKMVQIAWNSRDYTGLKTNYAKFV